MATNLRLKPEAEQALREASDRTGRSQQELIREAVDRFLGLAAPAPSGDELMARGVVRAARTPYRRAEQLLRLPEGISSIELLDREDRF